MEQYKALIIYTISDEIVKVSFEGELRVKGFEQLNDQAVFGLPLEEYRSKVQAVKTSLKTYCRKYLSEKDTVFFIESRMTPDCTLTTMLQTNLLKDKE